MRSTRQNLLWKLICFHIFKNYMFYHYTYFLVLYRLEHQDGYSTFNGQTHEWYGTPQNIFFSCFVKVVFIWWKVTNLFFIFCSLIEKFFKWMMESQQFELSSLLRVQRRPWAFECSFLSLSTKFIHQNISEKTKVT